MIDAPLITAGYPARPEHSDSRPLRSPHPPRPSNRVRLIVLPPVTSQTWDLIFAASASSNADARREALDALTRRYMTPVRRVLLAMGVRQQDVADLADEFLGLVMPARVLPVADPELGSFNGLLLTVLRRYLAERRRRELRRGDLHDRFAAERRALIHSRIEQISGAEPGVDRDARRIQLQRALRAAQEHFIATGRRQHWQAFALSILVPVAISAAAPSHDQLAAILSVSPGSGWAGDNPPTARRIAVMIRTVRARVRHELRDCQPDVVLHRQNRVSPDLAPADPTSD